MTHSWLVMVLKTGQNVGGGALNSFLVTWSLKGLIQFHEKGYRFTGAYQEHFERMRTPEKLGQNVMVEIIGTPLLGKIPIDIPFRASFSYFLRNGIVIMWKLLMKTHKSNFFRTYIHKYSKMLTVRLYITENFRFWLKTLCAVYLAKPLGYIPSV